MKPFLAFIVPLGETPELPPGPGNPPGIWGGGNQPFPTPPIPIYPGGSPNPPGGGGFPPGIWGGGNVPMPTPPIANVPGAPGYNPPIPGNPPGFWGGGNVPFPTPPIANVPGAPGWNPINPGPPPGIWGPNDPRPNPPIANVPGVPGYRPPVNPDLHPEHPIVIPPPGFPELPPGISHPITGLPSPTPPTDEDGWILVYYPDKDSYVWIKADDLNELMRVRR